MVEKLVLPKWLYLVLIFYAIQASINNFVRLYLLELGGGAYAVSLAASAYSLAIIPASLVAGALADYVSRRKSLLLISSVGQVATLFLLTRVTEIKLIVALYSMYSFISNFSPVVFSLLMIETLKKQHWGKGRDMILRNMLLGQALGLGLNELVISRYPVESVSSLPLVLSFVMLSLNLFVVKDPDILFERKMILMNPESLVGRLTQLPVMLLRVPHPADFKIVFRDLGNALTREIPVIIVSMNLFFFGTHLFATSYTPYLKSLGLSNLMMTSLDLVLALVQVMTIGKRFSDVSRRGDPAVAVEFFTLRALAFLFAAIISISLSASDIPLATAIIYLPIGLSYSNLVIGVHKMLYDILPRTQEGRTLGVYSSLNNAVMFAGSLISGALSTGYGYGVTFLLSSIALFTSASIFEWHFKPNRAWVEE